MSVTSILNTLMPGRAKREADRSRQQKLDEELTETFPTSDTPAAIQPGSGTTGAEVKPLHLSPSQKSRGVKIN